MFNARFAAFLAALLVLAGIAGRAPGQVYSGNGRAVLGTDMTPEDTEALAFEKARQAALEKFGAHVRSEQTLERVETPDGAREMSTNRIAVLAAGTASVVEGSKDVRRRATDETVVYEVRADFRIEPTDFEKTLEAYQNVGGDSRLKQSVRTAVDLQEELTQVESGTEGPEVRRLLSQTKSSYDAISAAVRDLDGSGLRSDIAKKRQRRKNALLRYMQAAKEHGYPGDLLSFTLSEPEVRDQGDKIEFTYEADYSWEEPSQDVTSTCSRTRPTWWPNEKGRVSRGWDGWIDQIFEARSPFSIENPVLLYMLDENDNVLLIVAKASKGMMSSPEMRFSYVRCSTDRLLHARLWPDEWEFQIPTEYVDEISSVAMMISSQEYQEIAHQSGFQQIERGIWAREGGRPVSVERFAYSREAFEDFVDSHAETVKSLPPGGS